MVSDATEASRDWKQSPTVGEGVDGELLESLYGARFNGRTDYRNGVWKILVDQFFSQWIAQDAAVLDVGCGYGEFINSVQSGSRAAIDLNPTTMTMLEDGIDLFQQDSTHTWPIEPGTLDVVFSSNFIEHLPSKDHILGMFSQAARCLRPGGRIILLGPNLRFTGQKYWDFFDHHIPLTDRSVCEALSSCGFEMEAVYPRVLPVSMSTGRQYPTWVLRSYLRFRPAWKIFGSQFVIVARRP